MHLALFCGTICVVQCASSASLLPFSKDAKTQAGDGDGGQGKGGGGGDAESEPGEVGERCCQAIKDKSC